MSFESWFIDLIDEFFQRGMYATAKLVIAQQDAVRRQWEELYAGEAETPQPEAV